ncbi:MAG: rhodanese-like domain-containing protein [Dehalococcoidia bacterium]
MRKIKSNQSLVILALLLVGATALFWRGGSQCGDLCVAEPSMEFGPGNSITATEAFIMIDENRVNDNFVILDVRTPAEYQGERIKGSLNLDYHSEGFTRNVREMETGTTYLIYCRSGRRSLEAMKLMSETGFREVYHLASGIDGWRSAGFPTEESYKTAVSSWGIMNTNASVA